MPFDGTPLPIHLPLSVEDQKVYDVLYRTRQLLEKRWARATYARRSITSGQWEYCLVGGLRHEMGLDPTAGVTSAERLESFNDHRRHETVLARLDTAIEIILTGKEYKRSNIPARIISFVRRSLKGGK